MRNVLRRHRGFAVLLGLGALLRVLAVAAVSPAVLFIDSFRYLDGVGAPRPGGPAPVGYEVVLTALLAVGDLRFVVLVQHSLGLALGVGVYALALRLGTGRLLAALAAAPVLLDAYQVQIEHTVMSDVWFSGVLVALVAALTWYGAPGPRLAAVAGLLLAAAVLLRVVGLALVVPVLLYLALARGRRVARTLSATAVCAAVLGGYVAWSGVTTGTWGLTSSGGGVAYGRAAVVADCSLLAAPERLLCPREPRADRLGVDHYTHSGDAPPRTVVLPDGLRVQDVERSFARQVLLHQPADVAAAVARDLLKGFRPTRTDAEDDVPVARWHWTTTYPYHWVPANVRAVALNHGDVPVGVRPAAAGVLRTYQLTVGYAPGPLLGLALLAGLVGGRRRPPAMLVAGLGVAVLAGAAAFAFSWRYQLPGLVLLPLAGALGLAPRPPRRLLAPYPDPVDAAARTTGALSAPVVVVIAARDEEDGIGAVLDAVPATACGLAVEVLVVADGCTDGTVAVARGRGARVCESAPGRGQGAALRLGYALARDAGARYVVTTDADGQYDAAELPLLLRPLVDGGADLVTGSRRLGRDTTPDPVRRLGVRVFAALASVLTGRRLTDTSFGFRAMTAELTGAVRLEQPQYQASELLLGAVLRGYRVAEVPLTMRARSAGATKKGGNLRYGVRYARAMLRTWWRDRRRS